MRMRRRKKEKEKGAKELEKYGLVKEEGRGEV